MTGTPGESPTTTGRRSAPRSGAAADQSRLIRRYLSAIEGSRPGRAARRAQEAVTSRIAKVDELLVSADPLARVHLTQERIELHTEQVRLGNGTSADLAQLERDFVRVARSYGDRHGLTYAAWRQVGVSTEVLDRAGIFRADRKPPTVKGDKGGAATTAEPGGEADASPPPPASPEESSDPAATATVADSPPRVSANGASGQPGEDRAPAPSAASPDDRSVPARAAMPLELGDDLSPPDADASSPGRIAPPGAGT